MDQNQAEEMGRAAEKLAEAVNHLDSTLNRFLEFQESGGRPGTTVLGYLGAGGYGEGGAVELALGLKPAVGAGARVG